ncbi:MULTISPECIES: hypothetical protein [Pseudomonas]|uniref:Uncharacterized protein n=1 Tax=Pseudomonas fluorescens TaxID=294 RepID=A0A166QQK7_PSEFL|nr:MULTISPECIES: hypothetical protein [Pseudomonas]KZN20699.1 hypothetical protein A1D17_03930 [Pseudomonas fluorescens]
METHVDVISSPVRKNYIECILLFGFAAYLHLCLGSYLWLAYAIPLNSDDLANSSWLGTQLGLGYHGLFFGLAIGFVALIRLISGRILGAVLLAYVAVLVIFSTSEYGALRAGVSLGDAKIGCFTYEALECRKMLNISEEGARSIYVDFQDKTVGSGRFAEWYRPLREQLIANTASALPSTAPGTALVLSPFMLLHMAEIRQQIEDQRQEVAKFKASRPK